MNVDLKECLEKRKLVRFPLAKKLVEREINQAKNDLTDSKDSLKVKKYKWATIQAYYSMFHAARSLIYRKGYREKTHYALMVALKSFCLEKGEISQETLNNCDTSLILLLNYSPLCRRPKESNGGHINFKGEFRHNFQTAKNLREDADYHAKYSRQGAESLIQAAEDFLDSIKQMREK